MPRATAAANWEMSVTHCRFLNGGYLAKISIYPQETHCNFEKIEIPVAIHPVLRNITGPSRLDQWITADKHPRQMNRMSKVIAPEVFYLRSRPHKLHCTCKGYLRIYTKQVNVCLQPYLRPYSILTLPTCLISNCPPLPFNPPKELAKVQYAAVPKG